MERLKVSQVAKILGITPTAVYKKFRTGSELVQNHVYKEKGITFIDMEGLEILKATMQNAHQEKEEPCRIEPVQNLVETLQKELDRKQGIIESLIAQQEEQRKRTDTILMKLTNDISGLQKALEYKKPEYWQDTFVSEIGANTKKNETPCRSAPPIVNPIKKEVTFREGFEQNMKEVQAWLQGVLAPFTEVFKGS